jgi:3-hydroxybutyryl-CoA dehydrogenase
MLRLAARPLSTTLGVVGCGLMGSGIVQMAATAGYRVISLEKDPKVLEKGLAMTGANVARALKSAVKKGKMTDTDAAQKEKDIMARIVPSTDLADFKECGLAIEAIVENMDAKIALFSDLEGIMADSAIIATNTSSLSVEKMGAKMAKRDRLLGLHFFNPVPLMPLCEVVKTNETSEDAMARALAFVEKCGKKRLRDPLFLFFFFFFFFFFFPFKLSRVSLCFQYI